MNVNQLEAAGLLAFAAFLDAQAANLVTDAGPINLVVENDVVKIADEAAASLPVFVKASIDAFIGVYGPQIAPLMAKEEKYGLADLSALAKAEAVKLAA